MRSNAPKIFYGQRIKNLFGSFVLLSACGTCGVNASSDQEHEILARLLVELKSLEIIVNESAQAVSEKDRQRFDYSALRQDLALITQGITDHLTMTRRDPHALLPLVGEYRE